MTVKMRAETTIVLADEDLRRLLTDSLCGSFTAFEHHYVGKVEQCEGFKFVVELWPKQPKPAAKPAATLGQAGGVARAEALPPERRSEIAKGAADARWQGKEKAVAMQPEGSA